MMPVHTRAANPSVPKLLETDYTIAKASYGTLNGGEIVVAREK